jgi:hypothetical protein
MDEIGRSYLSLALHLDRHFEGFVDAYFGPADLKKQVQAGEPRPLAALADDAAQLQSALRACDYDAQRREFLLKQVGAMAAVVRNLGGGHLGFVEEVELCFDLKPETADEALFEEAHARLEQAVPGPGTLLERLVAWRQSMELAPERILPVFDLARQETRRRTQALFDLPPDEELEVQLVKDQPWSAYNWYLGGHRSRIDINTDLPVRANTAVPLMAHEAYAGHHTEHALKEYLLYEGEGRAEQAVQLLLAPECVLSEGIADSAQDIIFDEEGLAAFLREEIYPLAGLPQADVEQQMRIARASELLSGVSGNAALLLYRDGRPAAEVQTYIEHYGLRTPKEAAQTMRFIQNPLFRSYIFNYASGKALLAPLLKGNGAVANFRRLLAEPMTPGQVRRWSSEL